MDAMDWEPEIPGQWNTPLRPQHQLVAAQATSSNAHSRANTPAPKDNLVNWKPEVRAELSRSSRKRTAAEAGILETVLESGSHFSTDIFQSFDLRASVFAPVANIIATTFRIIIQIYSTTLQGVGASRESTLATGTVHVVEERRTAADGFQSVKRRAVKSGGSKPVTSSTKDLSQNKRSTTHRSTTRSSHRQIGSHQMASSGESTAMQASAPSEHMAECIRPSKIQDRELPAGREALGVQLWASFTPAPISGIRDSLAIPQQTVNDIIPSNGEPDASTKSKGIILNPPPDKAPYKKIMSSKFDRSDRLPRIKPSLKSPLGGRGSRRLSGKINNDSIRLQNRRSLPQLSDSETPGQLTRSHTISETPSRRARFAINPYNGQPQENSVKFFKDSKIGEWAPSSPWVDEQTLALTSDLKHNLDALLKDDPAFDPLSTPILSVSESSTSDADEHSSPDENTISPPQDKHNPLQVVPRSLSDSDQQTTAEQLVDETIVAQALNDPVVTDSPFLRIKELVTGSFRKVFSPPSKGSSSDGVKKSPAQNATEHLRENRGLRSRINKSTHTLPICDIPGDRDRPTPEPTSNHINSNLHDGEQESEAKDFTGSDRKEDFDTMSPKRDVDDVDLEVGMSKLRMSTFAKEKLSRKRVEREAVAAKRKAAEEAAIAKAKAEAEAAERRASSHRRSPKEKLVKPLSKDWENKIREAMSKGETFALTTTVSGTELRRKDLVTVLGAREWLNDEIINAYLEWIVDYANKKAGKSGRNAIPKVIAHNSFFYKNIATQGPQSVSRWMKRKKAEGKKLLEVEIVLIPVNNASHWTIIVVSPKDRTIEYLDSFSGPSKVFIKHTKEWLAVELGHDWHEEEWRVLNTRSAEQLNGFDCGVFLLTNAECVVGGIATDSYDWNDMAAQRNRIAAVLLNRGFGHDIIPAEEL